MGGAVVKESFNLWVEEATALDAADPLAGLAVEFSKPAKGIYLDGNSLGLRSQAAQRGVETMLAEWGNDAVGGWKCDGWFDLAERLGDRLGRLVGAQPGETIVTGSTTANLHQLLATFYHPTSTRREILVDATAFPSDLHAIHSHLVLRGISNGVRFVSPDSRGLLDTAEIVAQMVDSVAVAVLPAVVYTTGQLLDLATISAAARDRGVLVLWDCSHSIGAVPHHFTQDRVDLAFWCNYKYINGGPGAAAAIYVSKTLWGKSAPGLAGWWGGRKATMFAMNGIHDPADGPAGLQIGTPHLLSMATLEGSLDLFERAGMENLRCKSLALTAFLRRLVAEFLPECQVVTPEEDDARGGHLTLRHPASRQLCHHLRRTGRVIGDFRPPDLLRLAPVAFYNSFSELVQAMAEIESSLGRDDFWEEGESATPLVT